MNRFFKAKFKNGKFIYSHKGISQESVDKIKFLLEGEDVSYRIKRNDEFPTKEMTTLASKEIIHPVLFESDMHVLDDKTDDGYPIRSLWSVLTESGQYDLSTFILELHSNTPRKKGRPVNHNNKYLVCCYTSLEKGECPDYCWAYPNNAGRAAAIGFVSGRTDEDNIREIISHENMLPESFYLRVSLKKINL